MGRGRKNGTDGLGHPNIMVIEQRLKGRFHKLFRVSSCYLVRTMVQVRIPTRTRRHPFSMPSHRVRDVRVYP